MVLWRGLVRLSVIVAFSSAAFTAAAAAAAAQTPASPAPGKKTVLIAAGPQYKAGPIHRFVLGPHYRKLWTTPIEVEVLDLGSFADGLTPLRKGGGKQTKSLGFRGADGREYRVRSVDKDPSATLPPELKDTFAEWVVQDQISAGHPAGPVVTDAFAKAAGIRHVKRQMVVIPDDPRLGEFRKEFGGMLGIMEVKPEPGDLLPPGFEGVTKIIESDELFKLMDADPSERVDSRALLKARLLDLFLGDWDRHHKQWSWVKVEGEPLWQPLPEDRDQAFAKFDGLALALARPSQPRLVDFEKEYPRMLGLGWNSRFLDRRLLGGLEKPVYVEVARELQAAFTDAVIEDGVRHLPEPYFRIDGPRMIAKLKGRRDLLPQAAVEFYELLANEVEVNGTDRAEVAEITRSDDGSVEVRLAAAENGSSEPFYRRRFNPDETSEVRVFLKGGHDRAVSRGKGTGSVKVRVMGGEGSDTLDDSAGGRTHFYDASGENRVVEGPGTEQSDRPYEHPKDRLGDPTRDWGRQVVYFPWLAGGGDLGVFLGAEVQVTAYGFRKDPYRYRQSFRAGYSTAQQGFKAEYQGEFRRTNSRKYGAVLLRASDVELIRFHGFGNETVATERGDFFKNEQRQFLVAPSLTVPVSRLSFTFGPTLKYTTTDLPPGRFISLVQPYGVEDFGQVGARAGLALDLRNRVRAASRGFLLWAEGNYYPEVWTVRSAFGEVHGEAATYLGAEGGLKPTLALRAGGKKVWGTFPFHEAAYIGGPETVRGLRRQRYAGDASLYGNAELRLKLFDFMFLVPTDLGVFGLTDAGRVYREGETSDKWHTGLGGGIWFSFLKPENTISLAAARSEGRTRVYFAAGFGF